MNSILNLLQRESPGMLAREALWRANKRWKIMRLPSRIGQERVQVRFVPTGYYAPVEDGITERARQSVECYADHIVAGRFPRFGYDPVDLGIPPDWHLDFVSGVEWPRSESDSLRIVRWDGSDVKVPWELSRLQFLIVMGKAWKISGDERIRSSAMDLLSDWIDQNPISTGINWTIAMEASLRAISICLFLELLWPLKAEDGDWLAKVTWSLWAHLHFIEAHNEFSNFARSNHYLSNITGLLCLSAYLHGPAMPKRFQTYSRLVQNELIFQTYDDGADYESSTGYHLLVLQMFSMSLRVLQMRRAEVANEFLDRLRAMYHWIAALADKQGVIPQLGDCDDGRVELLTDDLEQMTRIESADQNSLIVGGQLGVGGCLLGQDFGGHGDDAGWYGQGPCDSRGAGKQGKRRKVFFQSGVGILHGSDAEVIFLAMPNGIYGKGSHTHNDKLAILTRIAGKEMLVDSGTFCYTRDPVVRNWFRSTEAHNTLQIDNVEQNQFSLSNAELFRTGNDAEVSGITESQAQLVQSLTASHRGYDRLGVEHTRTVSLNEERLIEIEDIVSGVGEHMVEANWHFARKWQLKVRLNDEGAVMCQASHDIDVNIRVEASSKLDAETSPAFVSTTYGRRSESFRLAVRSRTSLPFRMLTTFSWEKSSSE